jgi:hypothetical protein
VLVVFTTVGQATVLGQHQQLFWREKDFEEYLLHFVRLPAFVRTLKALERRNSEPAEGFLRVGKPRHRNPDQDVFVEIPQDVQLQIGRAYRDGRDALIDAFDVKTSLGPPVARGAIDATKPEWLLAAGIVVELEPDKVRVDKGGKSVQLQGRVRPNL